MLIPLSSTRRVKELVRWILLLLSHCLGFARPRHQRERFLLLTPAITSPQIVYDNLNRKLIRIHTRNIIDFSVVRQVFVKHDYGLNKLSRGAELLELYESIVRSGKIPLIFDCGANSGMATLYFCSTFKDARVVAIEPDEDNLLLAKRNNVLSKADFLLAGVGSSNSRASIQDPSVDNWAYRVETSEDGTIEILSIAAILDRYDPNKFEPFIIKIDIEGFERNLFECNTEWVDQFPLIAIELHDWMLPLEGNSNNFLKAISSRNRDFVYFGENVFSIANPP